MSDVSQSRGASRAVAEETDQVSSTTDRSMWREIDHTVEQVPRFIPDIDVSAMRLLMTIRTAGSLIFYDLHSNLRSTTDLTAPALEVLLYLTLYDEVELASLTRLSEMSRASASALVASMAKRGLVVTKPSPDDKRKLIISASEEGRLAFRESFSAFNERESFWAEGLTHNERERLIDLIRKLVNYRHSGDDFLTRK